MTDERPTMLTEPTLRFLRELLGAQVVRLSDPTFEEAVAAAAQAMRELDAAIAEFEPETAEAS